MQSYASFLSRQGNSADALKVLGTFEEALPRHPLIAEERSEIDAGQKVQPMVDSAQAGAAEVLYGLGAALGRRGGEDLGLIYLQLALYLVPQHSLALLSLGDLYEALKNPELANKTYERVPPNSPLQRNAQIQIAMNLDTLERTDEAKAALEKLIGANPGDLEAIMPSSWSCRLPSYPLLIMPARKARPRSCIPGATGCAFCSRSWGFTGRSGRSPSFRQSQSFSRFFPSDSPFRSL